ncbi:MAG: efflux RND transporter permease subunit [Panacagrimonas sp.]
MNWGGHGKSSLFAVLATVLALALGLPGIEKNTSLDAFVPEGSPALALREQVESQFGLTEPIAIAYIGSAPGAAIDPAVLTEVREVSKLLQLQKGIDPAQVMSLSTRSWMRAENDTLEAVPLLPDGPISDESVDQLKRGLAASPAYRGLLLSEDLGSAMILAELRQDVDSGVVYEQIESWLRDRPLPANVELHIAGQATISGYLSRYIDQDTRKLVPAGILLCLLFMTLLLRSWAALAIGTFILLGTLASTLGLMGWLDKPLYIITSSLPVVLVCVSIADAIHLLARADKYRGEGLSAENAIERALQDLIRPLTLTTLTTACGFFGLTLGSQIPAMQQYGLFAAFGIGMAWLLTVFGAPQLYIWLSRTSGATPSSRWPERGAIALGRISGQMPTTLLVLAGGLIAAGTWGINQLQFNYERVRNFGDQSPVYRANHAINKHFAGSYNLDVYLESDSSTLTTPAHYRQIADLQQWMTDQGGFNDALSFVDIVRDTRRTANPDLNQDQPLSQDEIEQYLFLFQVSAKPGELAQRINTDRSKALLRGFLRTDNFQQVSPVVADLERELEQRFGGGQVRAQATGPVYVTSSWVGPLYGNTMMGVAIAVALVGIGAALVFRSMGSGLLCLMPVSIALLLVFGLMGATGIWLDVVTSMFATICIGLGVDFAIHMLHAIEQARRDGLTGVALSTEVYRRIGVPLSFNALALASGMLVTLLSAIPPVGYFGAITSVAVMSAYLAAMLTLQPLYVLLSRRTQQNQTTACRESA